MKTTQSKREQQEVRKFKSTCSRYLSTGLRLCPDHPDPHGQPPSQILLLERPRKTPPCRAGLPAGSPWVRLRS